MTDDLYQKRHDEIVDIDSCPKTKSVLLGAGVACALGFVPFSYPFFLHYIIGGFAVAAHFAKRHRVTLSGGQGAKLGALGALGGMLAFFVIGPLWYLPSIPKETWDKLSQEMIDQSYAKGRVEVAQLLESVDLSSMVTSMLIGMFLIFLVLSLALGALGGSFGAMLFKRGPEAM